MSDANILHIEKRDDPYARLDSRMLRDKSLSFAARGLLSYLLSHNSGWQARVPDLIEQSPAGRDAVYSLLHELETAGYIHSKRFRRDNGTFGFRRVVSETPMPPEKDQPTGTAFPEAVEPEAVEPDAVEPDTVAPDIKVPMSEVRINEVQGNEVRRTDGSAREILEPAPSQETPPPSAEKQFSIESKVAKEIRRICKKTTIILSPRDHESLLYVLRALDKSGATQTQLDEFARKVPGHWIAKGCAPKIMQILEHWDEVLALPEPNAEPNENGVNSNAQYGYRDGAHRPANNNAAANANNGRTSRAGIADAARARLAQRQADERNAAGDGR